MPIEIIITGVCGKMGRQIASIVQADESLILAGCTEMAGHACIGQKLSDVLGLQGCGVMVSGSFDDLPVEKCVIIDFSAPSATTAMLMALKHRQTRIVIGTTGLDAGQEKQITETAREIPVLYSPNMSLGVNVLFHLTRLAAQKLGETFDIEIIEAHHRLKKDAPSGTARRLGEIAAQARGMSYSGDTAHGRSGLVGERPQKQIGMHAVRGGDIVGDHTVMFAGAGERVELRHIAHSRETFARGAVAAAKWLSSKHAGLYSMQDLLGL